MPNAFAYIVLFLWPLVAIYLFHRHNVARAITWTVLGGYLLLPTQTSVDVPLLPAFDKNSISAVTALLLSSSRLRNFRELLPRDRIPQVLLLAFVLSPVVTAAMNGGPSVLGARVLPGLTTYDALSSALTHIMILIPFLIGQRFLASEKAIRDLLGSLVAAGLAYSVPAIFEVRFSPQLHTWIYGFFPHDFGQMIRAEGFRPMIFLSHGLVVALFFSMALLAAIALHFERPSRFRGKWTLAAAWLALTLGLCKSLGATIGAIALIAVFRLGRHAQRRTLLAIGTTVLLYPMLRGASLIPVQGLVECAAVLSQDRAASLDFRFYHEDMLLARASERPLFGWGGWGRNRVYDPETGADVSVTDGAWILVIGQYGWVGYIAMFSLLVLPLLLLGRDRMPCGPTHVFRAAGIILGMNLVDLLPNAGLTPITWLLAGGLTGAMARGRSHATKSA